MSALRQNAAWALAGNAGYAACQWGIVMAVAKHAAPADVGRFALAIAVTSPIVMLTNLQLRAVQATDAHRGTPFAAYLGLRLVSIGVAWLAIALVAAANGYDRATATLVAAMALAKGIEALADVVFGLQQQHENLRRVALSMLAKGAGSVALVAVVLARTGTLVPAVLAMAAWWAFVLVALDLRGATRLASLRPTLQPAVLMPLAWLALPLGLVMGLNSFAINVPRYAIAAELGPAALGYFAAAAYLLVAASQPMMALGAALSPRLARLHHEDRDAYRRLALRGLAAAAGLGVVGIAGTALVGRRFLALAYAPDYAAHYDLLVGLAIVSAVGFVSSGLGVAVTAARRFPAQLAIAAVSLALGALASWVLVPRYGLVGGALALLASELSRLGCLGVLFLRDCAAPAGKDRAQPLPVRVLHVFGSMDRGGAETRTLEIMRRVDGAAYRFDFCVLTGRPGAHAAEIAALGGTVLPCPLAPAPSFPLRLHCLLRAGRYDVVHSHVHQFSGIVLMVARLAGVRTRIAHLRSAHDGRSDALARRLYRATMRRLVDHAATTVIGVSASAMEAFWGAQWERDARRLVIYNGIEAGRFAGARDASATDAAGIRAALAIAPETRVVLHIGNFTPAKNHGALIAAAAVIGARRRDVVFVLVGDGALRSTIETAVEARGLGAGFRFTGSRDDVPALLRAADLLVLPSRWEGLPGVVLEALASGLPVVASPIGPVREIAGLAQGIRLADPARPEIFAAAIDETLGRTSERTPVATPLPAIFATETSMRRLLECYR
jgi:glycosyltransferase involved in cell wall biosynthesis/O-antigen/teichoic acid export membrane protein